MSLLYKDSKDLIYNIDVKTFPDGIVKLQFSADCGKHGTEELLDEFQFTVKELLSILQKYDAGAYQ